MYYNIKTTPIIGVVFCFSRFYKRGLMLFIFFLF